MAEPDLTPCGDRTGGTTDAGSDQSAGNDTDAAEQRPDTGPAAVPMPGAANDAIAVLWGLGRLGSLKVSWPLPGPSPTGRNDRERRLVRHQIIGDHHFAEDLQQELRALAGNVGSVSDRPIYPVTPGLDHWHGHRSDAPAMSPGDSQAALDLTLKLFR